MSNRESTKPEVAEELAEVLAMSCKSIWPIIILL